MNDHNKQVTLKYLKEKVERENIELNDNYILNEKLVAVCIKLIEKCTGFAKYLRMNKFNTYEIPYAVFSELSSYINEKFLNEEFLLIKSEPEYIEILQILMEMLSSGDPEIQGLVVVGFIQGVMNYIETQSNMINWRSSLMYNDLQNAFDNILNKTIFDKYEINS